MLNTNVSLESLKALKAFTKIHDAGAQLEISQGRGGVLEQWCFDKNFIYNTRKQSSRGKYFGAFSPTYFQNCILNDNFNRKQTQSGHFSKIRDHFQNGRGASPPIITYLQCAYCSIWSPGKIIILYCVLF